MDDDVRAVRSLRVFPGGAGTRRGVGHWLRRSVVVVLAVSLLLGVGFPAGGPAGDGGFPFGGLWSWLRAAAAWAAPDVGVPEQQRGPHSPRGHYVPAPSGGESVLGDNGLLASGVPRRQAGDGAAAPVAAGVFDPATSRRDADLSNETSTFYRNADGSVTLELSPGRVNYRTANGWEPIDTTLVEDGDRLRVAANDVAVSLAGPKRVERSLGAFADEGDRDQFGSWDELASLTFPGGQELGFDLPDAARVLPEVSGSRAVYRNVFPDTDVELLAMPEGLKVSPLREN